MTLGAKLLQLRNDKGLSQTQIADKLDVSQSAYNKWESDASKPNIENLLKICEFHEIDIYNLLDGLSNIIINNKNKIKESYLTGYNVNSTITINSPDLIKTVADNQTQIIKLIETQNELIKKIIFKE